MNLFNTSSTVGSANGLITPWHVSFAAVYVRHRHLRGDGDAVEAGKVTRILLSVESKAGPIGHDERFRTHRAGIAHLLFDAICRRNR